MNYLFKKINNLHLRMVAQPSSCKSTMAHIRRL